MSAVPPLALREWLDGLDCAQTLGTFEAEGFTTIAEVREANLNDDDLATLGVGAPELRAKMLAVLRHDSLAEWLSRPDVLGTSTQAQLQPGEALTLLQRTGIMTLAELVEAKPAKPDLKECGFAKMGSRNKVFNALEKLLQAGEQQGLSMDDPAVALAVRAIPSQLL